MVDNKNMEELNMDNKKYKQFTVRATLEFDIDFDTTDLDECKAMAVEYFYNTYRYILEEYEYRVYGMNEDYSLDYIEHKEEE